MKPLKIYFLGRRSGYGLFKLFPWIVENSRKDEINGLRKAVGIRQTGSIANAEILFFRNKPEKTRDALVSKLKGRIQPLRSQNLIINDIDSFYNYDSKDKAFSLWKKAGITTPEFLVIPDDSYQSIQKIQEFVNNHQQIFIRTNNETGSKGMELVNKNSSKDEIIWAVRKLLLRSEANRPFRSDSKVMAVKFIDARVESGHLDLYRAHVLGNDIISYYVVTSPKDTFHNQDMSMDDLDRFIWVNEQFGKRINEDRKFKETIINAVKVLGCNIGGIEFIMKNDVPVFLEHNPMWGGRASREGFGPIPFQAYLDNHKNELMSRIPLLFNWLDYENYYTDLYERIRDLYIQTMN